MISRRTFVAGALTAAGAAACGPLRSLAQHAGMTSGTLELAAPTTLPFVLSGNHVYIRASVGGKAFAFIFDTGGAAVVTPAVQAAMKFEVLGRARVGGAGDGSQSADIVRVPLARIGDAIYRDGPFVVLDAPPGVASPIPGLAFGGLFGRELFTELVTTLDYAKDALTFAPPARFTPDPQAMRLPMRLRGGVLPNVRASLDGHEGDFDVDAGSGAGLTLTAAFARDAGLETSAARRFDAIVGYGAGGPVRATMLRAGRFTLGDVSWEDPIVAIARSNGGVFTEAGLAGNIGGDVLRRFTVTLDAPGGSLYLVPNARVRDPFVFNRSGIMTRGTRDGDAVVEVVAGSPGAEAGILPGDLIVTVDGARAAHDLLASAFKQPAGTKVALGLVRGGARLAKTVALRDLL